MGFRSFVQTGITLQVGSAPEIPVTLAVGQVTESVQVEANVSRGRNPQRRRRDRDREPAHH